MSKFKLTQFSVIEQEEINWLWKPYFPLGAITCVTGDPGVGKSFLSIYLTSIITTGSIFPFTEKPVDIGNVIIQNSEDSKSSTTKPRLLNAKADNNKVYVIELHDEDDTSDDLMLKDVDELDEIFQELKPKLVIFDPITNFLGGDIDMNNAGKVRPYTKPIAKLAQKYNCAILFIIHRNKGNGNSNPLHRMMGSTDWGAIARSVISIGKNPTADEVLLMHTKCNVAEKGKTLAFKIEEGTIKWLGERGYIIDNEESSEIHKKSKREEAQEFLLEYLSENPNVEFKEIEEVAINKNIATKTLIRAREYLQENDEIVKKHKGNSTYTWSLSNHNGQIPIDR